MTDAQTAGAEKTDETPRQLAARLLLTGAKITEAAAAAGVHRNTVSRWRNHDPEFQLALAEERAALQRFTEDRLIGFTQLAVDTIAEIAADTEARHADRLGAAKVILDRLSPIQPPPVDKTPREVLGDNYDKIREAVAASLTDSH